MSRATTKKWLVILLTVIIISQTVYIYRVNKELNYRTELLLDNLITHQKQIDFLFKDYIHRRRTF